MAERLRFLPAGSDAMLVETSGLDAALALFEALRSARLESVTELVPAARTVLIRFDPLSTTQEKLVAAVLQVDVSARAELSGDTFEIPVAYDGEDLSDVAEMLGWSIEELVRRHTDATFTVAFTGFAPGFAYMTSDDPGFDVPRRKSPRKKIPAGAVALGGKFGGIYPSDSPGGWQLLGRTPVKMWDPARPRAALLTPGDRVRFRDMTKGASVAIAYDAVVPAPTPAETNDGERAVPVYTQGLLVTRADRLVLFQDLGRAGHAGQGVSASGAVDRAALRRANRSVGNPPDAAAIEVTFGGFAIKAECAITMAAAGAPCPLLVKTADGRQVALPFGMPFALDAGDELSLGIPTAGMRTYLALRGGYVVETALGSASSDTLARIGPPQILAGDVILPANGGAVSVMPDELEFAPLPGAADTVTVDVLLGPRTDWFTTNGVDTLLSQAWQVTAESSRVGVRIAGPVSIERRDDSELPSEAAVRGSIQVPHNGQPVVFLTDHPLTAGYPVIAVVAAHHLDLIGQIPIGAHVRFNAVTSFDPLTRDIDR